MTTTTRGRGLRRRLQAAAAVRAVWHVEDGLYEHVRGAFVPETSVRDFPPSACADPLTRADPA